MSERSNEFDSEFLGDTEREEAIDDVLEAVGKRLLEEEQKISIINQYRVKTVLDVYKMFKRCFDGTDVEVSYDLHEPYTFSGCVSILGKDITFTDAECFLRGAKLAANVDIYPRTDGNVKIDFTFYGLATPIE